MLLLGLLDWIRIGYLQRDLTVALCSLPFPSTFLFFSSSVLFFLIAYHTSTTSTYIHTYIHTYLDSFFFFCFGQQTMSFLPLLTMLHIQTQTSFFEIFFMQLELCMPRSFFLFIIEKSTCPLSTVCMYSTKYT